MLVSTMAFNKTATAQVLSLVEKWNATHPPEFRATVVEDIHIPHIAISLNVNGKTKQIDVLEPVGQLPLSDSEELSILYQMETQI
jgi:hypothetical protein